MLSMNRGFCSAFRWIVQLFIFFETFHFCYGFCFCHDFDSYHLYEGSHLLETGWLLCYLSLLTKFERFKFFFSGHFIILLSLLSILVEQCLFSPVSTLQHFLILRSNYFCATVSSKRLFLILRSSSKVGLRFGAPWLYHLHSFYYKAHFPLFCKIGPRKVPQFDFDLIIIRIILLCFSKK